MTAIDFLRWLHVVGATVLLGTGAGIAFFMFMANRTRDPALIAHTSSIVVVADMVFTASAVIVQPISGVLLAQQIGWSLTQGWLMLSILLYLVTGFCWLPVLWIQIQLRNIAREAANKDEPLPVRYHKLYRVWFMLGIPAFLSVLAIIWLMLRKPAL